MIIDDRLLPDSDPISCSLAILKINRCGGRGLLGHTDDVNNNSGLLSPDLCGLDTVHWLDPC